MRALPLLATVALAVCASCVPARLDPVNGISLEGIAKALGASPSPSPGVREVDEFGRPVSPRPSGSASPSPSAAPKDACGTDVPAGVPVTGTPAQGAYAGKQLPSGWGTHADEAAVTDAIRKLEGTSAWACFEKFYPDALAVYRSKK